MRFTGALTAEKRYIDAIKKYGLDSPLTYKSRVKLQRQIKLFERETGIEWPIK
jgi:hypothetical protein